MPICAVSLLISTSSYGALSATSANTIKGNAPWFTGQSGAKKLGFVVDGISYSEANDAYDAVRNPNKDKIISGIPKNFNSSLRLRDFTVTGLTANDFSPTTDYYDADGDVGYASSADTFSMEDVTFDWYEGNRKLDKNNSTVMNQTLGCGSSLSLPLTLKITLPSVKVKSRYGNPKESGETDLVQEYKIGSESGICFAKPNQMIVIPQYTWVGTDNTIWYWHDARYKARNQYGGGYDSTQFDPDNGFKASLSTKFPTTGFPKASFTLIVVGSPSDYTFTSNAEPAVTVDASGKVTLNSKPSGAVTIKAVSNGTTHTYTFNPTTAWVVPKFSGNYASAVSVCGGESKIPTRADLTNSPFNNVEQGWTYKMNGYTRAIGGGVFGEWGWPEGGSSGSYPGSQWGSSPDDHWTSEAHSSGQQFIVLSSYGLVRYTVSGVSKYIVCLG
ncbi:hypothetical protein RCS94_01415 [Orbaceae bacterium ac157xtp]